MNSNIYFDKLPTHALDDGMPLPPLFAFVDGRDLACPMPLLKTKLALRQLGTNTETNTGTIYTISTDPNSATDLTAFCQKNGLAIEHWQSDNDGGAVFHFLIKK